MEVECKQELNPKIELRTSCRCPNGYSHWLSSCCHLNVVYLNSASGIDINILTFNKQEREQHRRKE